MAFRNRPVNGCPPKSSAPGTYWPVSTAHSPARRYEHILSSPNLTPLPTFPFPETHWYPFQTTRTNMFPKPPTLKFLRACTYSELLCYNRRVRSCKRCPEIRTKPAASAHSNALRCAHSNALPSAQVTCTMFVSQKKDATGKQLPGSPPGPPGSPKAHPPKVISSRNSEPWAPSQRG